MVKQEKRIAYLVEKVTNLFQKASEGRFAQALAFCLKQFTYNEKSIKVIIDHLPHYSNKLGDDIIFESFSAILENARKNCKADNIRVREPIIDNSLSFSFSVISIL